ncbi:MAG: phosphoheptose isomerase [Flavobacteriales bacterium]|nr:phosphoheptose isomerase [Flavobacteriales bacterium]|tara:strand:- start:158842 stop:159423 length:582 start_codon:yes stop_codon:yes gene_type:complete
MKDRIQKIISDSLEIHTRLIEGHDLQSSIKKIVSISVEAFKNGNKLLLCGNGGSASDAQHIAAELSGRFYKDRPPLHAEALNVNTSFLTAVANDFGYDQTLARMLEACGKKKDILIAISTSGNSNNIIEVLRKARNLDIVTIGFSGQDGGRMQSLCDIMINAPSNNTARIQEIHILCGHIICQLIEEEIFPNV